MSRTEFLAIGDIVYQRAAYVTFTPNQKQALWIEKLEKALKLEWSEQESLHIQSMLDLVNANLFAFSKDRDQEAFDKVEIELYKWKEYSQEVLGWDIYLLYALVATPQMMNADKTIKLELGTTPTFKRDGEGCTCSFGSDWCTFPNGDVAKCLPDGCAGTSWGCGNFWWFACDGTCHSI